MFTLVARPELGDLVVTRAILLAREATLNVPPLTYITVQGKLYVRGDSKIFRFQNGKSESLFLQRKNPRRIAWTVLYRRQHRKGISEVRMTPSTTGKLRLHCEFRERQDRILFKNDAHKPLPSSPSAPSSVHLLM
jgi:ribosomal protein L24E